MALYDVGVCSIQKCLWLVVKIINGLFVDIFFKNMIMVRFINYCVWFSVFIGFDDNILITFITKFVHYEFDSRNAHNYLGCIVSWRWRFLYQKFLNVLILKCKCIWLCSATCTSKWG